MMYYGESAYYPAGAYNDPNAPWNQSEPPERDFDVTVRTTLVKDDIITTSAYQPEYDEEDGVTYANTDDVDWKDEYHACCNTPLELICKFKECLEFMRDNGIKWKGNNLKSLIDECDGWKEEDLEVEES